MPDDPDLFIGATIRGFAAKQKVFGRYELAKLLGRGGMGVVWLATDNELDRKVALKFVPELLANEPTAIAELKRETRRSLDLTHQNIVRVYDFVQDESLAAISMEFIEGKTLAEMRSGRRGGAFDPADLVPWLEQLCAALDFAHKDAQVVHRDLKPANIMIDDRGRVKITDFGISATVSETVTRVTRVASTSGTLTYMSPQQMLGQAPTLSDDIYSLGAVLYDLLTGKPPFFRGNIPLQVERQEAPTVTSRRSEFEIPGDPIPDNWEQAIAACLSKDPTKRPATAGEVVDRITSGNGKSRPPPPPPIPDAPPPATPAIPSTKRKTHGFAIAAILMLGLLAGAGAAYYFGLVPEEWLPHSLQTTTTDSDSTVAVGPIQTLPDGTTGTDAEADLPPTVVFDPGAETTMFDSQTGEPLPPDQEAGQLSEPLDPSGNVADPSANEIVIVAAEDGTLTEPTVVFDPPPPPPEFVVQVEPPIESARVWIGPRADLAVDGNGRLILSDLPTGSHTLTVQAPGYEPYSATVEMTESGGIHTLSLQPTLAALAVTARPGTVVSAIDSRGRVTMLGSADENGTLVRENLLPVGRYTVRFEHPDCETVELTGVELTGTRRGSFAPEQRLLPGDIRVFTAPDGADVSVDGRVVGKTPLMLTDVPAGQTMRIEVSLSGFDNISQEVTINPRETRILNFGTLIAESGAISFGFSDRTLNLSRARVLVDGEHVAPWHDGSTWRVDNIAPGVHSVEIIHPDFAPWKQQVTTASARTIGLRVDFAEKTASVHLRVTGPSSYVVTVDGRRVDVSSGALAVPTGRDVLLEVSAERRRTVSRIFNLGAGTNEFWSVELLPIDLATEGEPFLAQSIGLQMVWIPPGEFIMGSRETESGPDSDERPLMRVRLTSGYWMGSTEVTQAQWSAIMEQNPSHFSSNTRAPVDRITWDEAMIFCQRLTQRERTAGRLPNNLHFTLPTEAQWEYACRAGTTSAYHGPLDAVGWVGVRETQPVGQKQANRWGLYDMHGNVAEWTLSWYGRYPGGNQTDFAGPTRGRVRVIRGGSIDSSDRTSRSAYRNWVSPTASDEVVGLRVVLVKR